MPKIHCPFHADENPSAELYPSGAAFCFVCWRRFGGEGGQPTADKDVKPPEDIEASLVRIKSLPIKPIRGLWFHADTRGFYLIWPNALYYKCRLNSDTGPRYLCPRGTKQPLLIIENMGNNGLAIVEGEINALSIAETAAKYGFTVVSPGSAGNFQSTAEELRALIKEYPAVFCWSDKDSPGIQALWRVARLCAEENKPLSYLSVEIDANEVLIKGGETAVDLMLSPFMSNAF